VLVPCSKHVDGRSPIASRARKNVNIIPVTIRNESSVPHIFALSTLRNVFRSSIDFDFQSTAVLRMVENERKKILINSSVHSLLILTVADPLDHATGLEKREMLAHLAGNDVSCDVFSLASTSIFLWLCCTNDIIISDIIT